MGKLKEGGKSLLNCSITRMFDYSNVRLLNCSIARMLDCSNARMFDYSNVRLLECSNARNNSALCIMNCAL